MGLLCTCPQNAAISDIPIDECPESMGQIQKIILQRIFSAPGIKNAFQVGVNNPNVLASWTPLLAAADGTKVVVSPYIQEPVTEAGAKREYGGGNATLGGIPLNIGREPTSFTGNILRNAQKTIKAMKDYECENIGMYLVDEYGRIAGLVDDHDAPTEVYPIPTSGFFVSDKTLGGLESIDMNMVSWYFFPNWSDQFHIVTPTDFNGLELAA